MTWAVERVGSALHVTIEAPMNGEWETLVAAVQDDLEPKPLAIHIPSKVPGATPQEEEQLRALWDSLASAGIPLLPPA